MSGRHGHNDGRQDDPRAAVEREAINTANQITGLGWRLLQHREVLEHPKVVSALRNLAELLPYADETPGRHRASDDGEIGQQISEAFGEDLKPSPRSATTPAEFIDSLMQYRAWSGDPSWRIIAKQSGHTVPYSTMWNAMNGDFLPKLNIVQAIVVGCGGGEEDLRAFINAWRRIALNKDRMDRHYPRL